MLTKEIQDVLHKYGKDIIAEAVVNLKEKGRFGTGRLAKSLKPEVKEAADQIALLFYGEDYAVFVEEGRRPGATPPPTNAIIGWIRRAGLNIPEKKAFGIARNIGRFGIPPTHFFKDAVDSLKPQLLAELDKAVKLAISRAINDDIS